MMFTNAPEMVDYWAWCIGCSLVYHITSSWEVTHAANPMMPRLWWKLVKGERGMIWLLKIFHLPSTQAT